MERYAAKRAAPSDLPASTGSTCTFCASLLMFTAVVASLAVGWPMYACDSAGRFPTHHTALPTVPATHGARNGK